MKKAVQFILFVLLAHYGCMVSIAADTSGFDAYYDIASVGNPSPASELAITRQNSCAIQLKNIVFEEVQAGNFVPHLTIKFRNQLPNGSFEDIYTAAILFDNAISDVAGNGIISFRLNNQALATGVNLSKVSIVRVEMRLHRVKDQFMEFSQVMKPLLNTVQGSQQSIVILENLIEKFQDGPTAPLLFSSDFAVAGNTLEYQKMSEVFDGAFLKNNQEYLIPMEGTTLVTNTSLAGKITDLVNLGARAVFNSRVINPATAKLKGYASLVFTKDRVPMLPADLEGRLRDVARQLTKGAFDQNSFNVAANSAEGTAVYLESTKIIDTRVSDTVMEYISLARIFAAQRAAQPDNSWDADFSNWLLSFKIRAATLSAQSVGIGGLYLPVNGTEKIAPIYLPYFLPDDLLASFQTWQVMLHKAMKKKNNFSGSVSKTA